VAQTLDGGPAFLAGVDHILGQGADDAVSTGIHLAYLAAVPARRLNQAAGRGIDDGGDAARLCIERILHETPGHKARRIADRPRFDDRAARRYGSALSRL
jgi:hypothetical protein